MLCLLWCLLVLSCFYWCINTSYSMVLKSATVKQLNRPIPCYYVSKCNLVMALLDVSLTCAWVIQGYFTSFVYMMTYNQFSFESNIEKLDFSHHVESEPRAGNGWAMYELPTDVVLKYCLQVECLDDFVIMVFIYEFVCCFYASLDSLTQMHRFIHVLLLF